MATAISIAKLALFIACAWLVGTLALFATIYWHQAFLVLDHTEVATWNASQASLALKASAETWQDASKKQAVYWDGITRQTADTLKAANQTVTDLDAMVRNTNTNLNAGLGTLNTAIANQDAALTQVDRAALASIADLQTDVRALKDTETAATKTVNDLDALILDPSIRQTFAHVDASSASFEVMAKHGEVVSLHGENISKDADEYFHRLTRPVSFAHQLFTTLLGITAQTATIYYGYVK